MYIGYGAFQRCSRLTSLEISSGVTTIGGDRMFEGCESLKSVVIPPSVCIMEGNPFEGWHGHLVINSPSFSYENDVLIDENKNALIAFRSKVKSYVVPPTVTSIGDGAFAGCSSLTSIVLPSSVTSIGESAFFGCSGLTSIEIPFGVKSIGNYAFYGCKGLTSVTISESVKSIGYSAFYACLSLTSIVVRSRVLSIATGAFYGCGNLDDSSRMEMQRRFGENVVD